MSECRPWRNSPTSESGQTCGHGTVHNQASAPEQLGQLSPVAHPRRPSAACPDSLPTGPSGLSPENPRQSVDDPAALWSQMEANPQPAVPAETCRMAYLHSLRQSPSYDNATLPETKSSRPVRSNPHTAQDPANDVPSAAQTLPIPAIRQPVAQTPPPKDPQEIAAAAPQSPEDPLTENKHDEAEPPGSHLPRDATAAPPAPPADTDQLCHAASLSP